MADASEVVVPVRLDEPVMLHGANGRYGNAGMWARHDPALPSAVVGYAATCSPDEAIATVSGAHEAFRDWSTRSVDDRYERVQAAFAVVAAHEEEIARLLATEVGKTFREAQLEAKLFVMALDWFADGFATFRQHASYTFDDDKTVVHRPVGVTVMVLPWNWPLFQLAGKLVPALLTGNTAIIKPSPMAALVIGRVVELLNDTLPLGVVSTVLGANDTTVKAVLTDRRVAFISFTGSVATGRQIARIAAEGPTRVVLELGGNDPAILRHDVTLDDRTIVSLMQSMFTTTGQGCQLIKRIVVHESRHDELVDRLVHGIDGYYRLGHPLDVNVTMGPLVSAAQRDRVRGMVDAAVSQGARAHTLGVGPDETYADGWFLRPTLVTHVNNDAALVVDEQFGPAVPLIAFRDDAEAIALANDTPFGLGSSIWSDDLDAAHTLAQQLHAGVTYLNNHNAFAVFRDTAVGGVGESGVGVEWGVGGLMEYTRDHIVSARKR